MEKTKELIRKRKDTDGLCQINIRMSKKLSDWLSKENLSPTAVFNKACKELGFEE